MERFSESLLIQPNNLGANHLPQQNK